MKRIALGILFTLLFVSVFMGAFNVQSAKALTCTYTASVPLTSAKGLNGEVKE
jgi:hypothetical protein